jgi:hypothetical protein
MRETNVIAGVTIAGNTRCKSANATLRLDTESVRAESVRVFLTS